jgi:hypothetical protein
MTSALFGLVGAVVTTLGVMQGSFSLFCWGSALMGVPNSFGQYYRFAAAEVASEEFRSRAISYVMAGGVIAAFAGPNLASWSRQVLPAQFAGSYASLVGLYLLSFGFAGLLRIPRPTRLSRVQGGRPLLVIACQRTYLVAMASAVVGYGAMNLIMIATPLAMQDYAHPFADTALVIQWHIFGMFVPSFFTGHLIQRFGIANVLLTGILLLGLGIGINAVGHSVGHFWWSMLAIGIGWNFLFIGSTTLLTETYTFEEKERAQALNDFMVFGTVSLTSFISGIAQHRVGWETVNLLIVPFLLIILIANLWLRRKSPQLVPTK